MKKAFTKKNILYVLAYIMVLYILVNISSSTSWLIFVNVFAFIKGLFFVEIRTHIFNILGIK